MNMDTEKRAELGAFCSREAPPSAKKRLSELCGRVFLLPPDDSLSEPVAAHPDMLLTVIGENLICHRDYFEKNSALMEEACAFFGCAPILSESKRAPTYPHDVAFNALVTDKFVFCNTSHTAREVLMCAENAGLRVVHVNQGYAACSCIYAEGTLISADMSLLCAAEKNGVRTLKVPPGNITLAPYDTGFIGGASGFFDGTLYTFGNIPRADGFEPLLDFLDARKIKILPLCEGGLSDFGGIKLAARKNK